jgi:hypothetical protein
MPVEECCYRRIHAKKPGRACARWGRTAAVFRQRLIKRALLAGVIAALAVATEALANLALAQGKLDSRYVASLAGVSVGKGAWVIDIAGDQYVAAASGMTAGLLRVFSSGKGTGAARGMISGGRPVPASYAATYTYNSKTDEIRMTLAGGSVKDYEVVPPVVARPDRVPVTEAHRRGVFDPMTVMLNTVPGNGNPVSPKACGRTAAVFDGRMRYNLESEFKRMEIVKAERGYQGPAVVCALYFTPVSGFIRDRYAIKYLSELRDSEVWFAPIAGTRVLVPFRISIPTPVGLGVLQATQFISTPQPMRASADGPKAR